MFGYVFGLLLPSASWIAANPYWFHPGVICAKGHSTAKVSRFRVQGPNDKHRFKSIYSFIQTLNLNVISFPPKTCAMARCVCVCLAGVCFCLTHLLFKRCAWQTKKIYYTYPLCLSMEIRRPGSACTVFFSYVASKILSQLANPKSPVPQTPKISKIQNPRSPKSKIQNPKSPKSKIPKFQNPYFAHKDLLHNVPKIQNPKSPKSRKSRIQNPQNPKSKIPKIQNPKSPKSKIQNPKSPKSKILYPQLPKSKIQNPRQNPKYGALGPHIKNCYITIQNPKSKIQKIWPKKFGLGILDFGFGIPAPKSKIQTPQNPKSKIPKIQNLKSPKSKIQNLKSPKSPKSKIQNPPPKSKIWGVGGLT